MHGGYANFYSRPCGRGDEADVCGRNAVIISTHAPAGGATVGDCTVRAIAKGFLLTPLREGRLGAKLSRRRYPHISTHAPAGGATQSTS